MPDTMQFASAFATERSVDSAIQALTWEIRAQANLSSLDLALVFLSSHFGPVTALVTDRLRDALNPRVLIGCTCEGVIGKDRELENQPAIAMVAARLPRVEFVPFALTRDDWDALDNPEQFYGLVGMPKNTRLFIFIGDPFSMPIDRVLDAFNTHCAGIPMIGGMASGASHPGGNALILNDRAFTSGAVGLALSGDIEIDVIVSQGCRPFGQTYTVTEAQGNVISKLEGEPPLLLLEHLIEQLSEQDYALLQNGLFVGRAIGPDDDSARRGDFLIRTLMGTDRATGAIVVGDYIHAGETIQFHLRDQNTAKEDLEMLLMPQALDAPASGGLLFSCNGRGTRLYDHPNGDISTIQNLLGGVSIAGFFCAGELGPIGGKNFLHGHTASLALFRPCSECPND